MTGSRMRPEDPMHHSGAVWCEDHDRWECARKSKRTDSRCHGVALRGLDRCRMHRGIARELARAQGEAKLAAWSLAAAADQAPLDPGQAVLQMLSLTASRVEVLGELLRVQVEDQDYEGLVGSTWAAGRDGARVETGEQVRGLAKYEADERDRLVRYAKAAHDMGIAERHIELQQAQAQIVVAAARAMLDALDLSPADRDRGLTAFLGGLGRGPDLPELPVAGAVEG